MKKSIYLYKLFLVGFIFCFTTCNTDQEVILPVLNSIPPNLDPPTEPISEDAKTTIELFDIINNYKGELLPLDSLQNGNTLITSGYVVSSDFSKNIIKALFIQNNFENPNAGVVLDIDKEDIHLNHGIGNQIVANLNGLGMILKDNLYHIGRIENDSIKPLTEEDFELRIASRNGPKKPIKPIVTTLTDISEEKIPRGVWIKLEDIQFSDDDLQKTYAEPDSDETTRTLLSCPDANVTIPITIMGTSSFKGYPIPLQKGPILAINAKDYLLINNKTDIQFDSDMCEGDGSDIRGNLSIKDVVAAYTGNALNFADYTGFNLPEGEEPVLSGYLTKADFNEGKQRIFIQDQIGNSFAGPAGLIVKVETSLKLDRARVGTKINIQLSNLGINNIDGLLQIGVLSERSEVIAIDNSIGFNKTISLTTEVNPITPFEVLDLDFLLGSLPNSILISVDLMQLRSNEIFEIGRYNEDTSRTFYSCSNGVDIEVRKIFSNQLTKDTQNELKGSIIELVGITSIDKKKNKLILLLRREEDLISRKIMRCTEPEPEPMSP